MTEQDKSVVLIEAEHLISIFERTPGGVLELSQAEPLILALGGSIGAVKSCPHAASIAIYISALIIRNNKGAISCQSY